MGTIDGGLPGWGHVDITLEFFCLFVPSSFGSCWMRDTLLVIILIRGMDVKSLVYISNSRVDSRKDELLLG